MTRHNNATSSSTHTPRRGGSRGSRYGSRRGSVLIMVIALLVLMAMIGTAYIATVRIDRYGSRIHVEQVEDEVIREGFIDQVLAQVIRAIQTDDQAITAPQRQAGGPGQPWLANRLPDLHPVSVPGDPFPIWDAISGALSDNMLNLQPGEQSRFRTPLRPVPAVPDSSIYHVPVEERASAMPESIRITYPPDYPHEHMRNRTRVFPALRFFSRTNTPSWPWDPHPTHHGPYLAADASGDGVADAVLFRLNDVPIKGVVYYGTVRIIDHGSAINVNTARSMKFDYGVSGNVETANIQSPAVFPAHIGLNEMLFGYSTAQTVERPEMFDLNFYRFGFEEAGVNGAQWFPDPSGRIVAAPEPIEDPDISNNVPPLSRPDFTFISQADAFYMQAGRKLQYPGHNRHPDYQPPRQPYHDIPGIPPPQRGDPFLYRTFGMNDAAALAYRFMMISPHTTTTEQIAPGQFAVAPAQDVEARLDISTFRTAANYARNPALFEQVLPYFPANNQQVWYEFLNYLDPSPTFPDGPVNQFRAIRPLLTTTSPVMTRAPRAINGIYEWMPPPVDPELNAPILHPGMLSYNARFRIDLPDDIWRSNVVYNVNDIVRDPAPPTGNGLMYVRVRWSATQNPQPSSDLNREYWDIQPPVTGNRATSMNTAGFPELWRSFRILMSNAGDPTGVGNWTEAPSGVDDFMWQNDLDWNDTDFSSQAVRYDPYLGGHFDPDTFEIDNGPNWTGTDDEFHPLQMFRSTIRTHSSPPAAGQVRFLPSQMMALRSAIAAANMLHLRQMDPNEDINDEVATQRTIRLYEPSNLSNPPHPMTPEYEVTIYAVRHPFITEVFAHTDMETDYSVPEDGTGVNLNGFIAIELHNPYDQPIDLTGYRLAIISRLPGIAGPMSVQEIPDADLTGIVIPGDQAAPGTGYVVLHNYNQTVPDAAQAIPPSAGTINNDHYIQNLHMAFNHELVLLRPPDPDPANAPANLYDYIPVDSFDFTGLEPPTLGGEAHAWHYVRANDAAAAPSKAWHFVYPGRYDGLRGNPGEPRHQGTQTATWTPSLYPADPLGWDPWWDTSADDRDNLNYDPPPTAVLPNFGQPDPIATYEMNFETGNPLAVPNTFPIPLYRTDWRVNPLIGATGNQFPFGGFARNGDILQVPFIGAYRVRQLNPAPPPSGSPNPDPGIVSNPADIVEFNSITMDAVFAEDSIPGSNLGENIGRFAPLDPDNLHLAYKWATRVFEFFTVQNPHDDYLPNIDPELYHKVTRDAGAPRWPQPVRNRPMPDGEPANYLIGINGLIIGQEDNVADQGKININTAAEAVLRMVPLIADASSGQALENETRTLATAIADYRRTNDPFESLFDLNRVNQFLNPPAGSVPSLPPGYEANFYMLTRMSNLLTTRSDAFTCYILVQGWKEAESAQWPPMLDWEQRMAFIIERRINEDGEPTVTVTPVPTQ